MLKYLKLQNYNYGEKVSRVAGYLLARHLTAAIWTATNYTTCCTRQILPGQSPDSRGQILPGAIATSPEQVTYEITLELFLHNYVDIK